MKSNFGDERAFTEGDNTVRAVPRFVDPTAEDPTISQVIITKMDGDRRTIERMAARIKSTYTGAHYSTWQRGQ